MNDQSTLAEMVRAMSNLTEINEVLTNTNEALTHQLGVLQKAKGPNNPRNPRTGAGVGPPKEMKLCPNARLRYSILLRIVSNCRRTRRSALTIGCRRCDGMG